MSALSKQQKLDAIKQRQAQLKAEEIAIQNELKKQKRSEETRQKIIGGAAAFAHAAVDPVFAHALHDALGKAVTKPADRELLKPLFPLYKGKQSDTPAASMPESPEPIPPSPHDDPGNSFADASEAVTANLHAVPDQKTNDFEALFDQPQSA